jgi:C1A family cysteine protease
MATASEVNKEMVKKYKVDNTILESYFKNASNAKVTGVVFPLRLDNRQYCSPTDYQGDKPSCCGYSTAQILESLNWLDTGKIYQMDADQIYAKAKETDKQMSQGGTYPDLAMQKGLELIKDGTKRYKVMSSTSRDVDELKRVIHKSMFASVNMVVTKDIYNLDDKNFVYEGWDKKAGGHSLVCCGYDEQSKMFILQNHWGTIWGLKGFFLCPYDVWRKQCNIFCWYERAV